MLSGIEHFEYCQRQWALIHIEQLWKDNGLTTAGTIVHERADDYAQSETRGDLLILRNLRVFSATLGVTGACDVVEFRRSDSGATLSGRDGRWQPYPVEYKHGGAQPYNRAGHYQLCCEAMCLEEMLSCTIPAGAMYYNKNRRREVVEFDEDLRQRVRDDLASMHTLFERGHTPRVRRSKKRCRSCSLVDLCLPELGSSESASSYINERIEELAGGLNGKTQNEV